MPAAATIFEISGRQVACSPISKNVALAQLSVQRLEHRGVFPATGRRRKSARLLVAQEVVLLEVLGAESRAAGGVDFDDARQTERVGFVQAEWGAPERRRPAAGQPGRKQGRPPAQAKRQQVRAAG
jgi:hypothetical protein